MTRRESILGRSLEDRATCLPDHIQLYHRELPTPCNAMHARARRGCGVCEGVVYTVVVLLCSIETVRRCARRRVCLGCHADLTRTTASTSQLHMMRPFLTITTSTHATAHAERTHQEWHQCFAIHAQRAESCDPVTCVERHHHKRIEAPTQAKCMPRLAL